MSDTPDRKSAPKPGPKIGPTIGEPKTWHPQADEAGKADARPREYGGRRDGLDPTRYGDWEKNGRCIDF